jgi:hypothetical protein
VGRGRPGGQKDIHRRAANPKGAERPLLPAPPRHATEAAPTGENGHGRWPGDLTGLWQDVGELDFSHTSTIAVNFANPDDLMNFTVPATPLYHHA